MSMIPSGYVSPALVLILSLFVFPSNLYAEDLIDQSSNVFKFQHKLANKDHVNAQYKLASMYERGEGTEQNIEQAKHWYARASEAGMKAAADRNTYLKVKEQGYKQTDTAWLESIKANASNNNSEAMLLLGQLYREGLGVNKDLNKSLELLSQVGLLGEADVDKQIESIQAEIAANNKAQENLRKQQKMEARSAQVKKIKQAEAEQRNQAEKKRKYEEAMMKLKLEQQQIDEQQAWASGDSLTTVDDEI